jgi:hypothetical protein
MGLIFPDQRNPRDISYLMQGPERQRAAYHALQALEIFNYLAVYTPVLVGTLPLGVDLPGSDLDILCEVHDTQSFKRSLQAHYALPTDNFTWHEKQIDNLPVAIARFQHAGFPVEIFGQPLPVLQQRAFRHMQVEIRLLQLGGEQAIQAIRALRTAGLKTEPAFARYFQLAGDPYETLLKLEELDNLQLSQVVAPSTP